MKLTVAGLKAIKPGQKLTADGTKGEGRLVAQGVRGGTVHFYFRHTKADGARDSIPIGRFDPSGTNGLTLADATKEAADLRLRYQRGDRDLRTAVEAEKRERQRLVRQQEEAERAAQSKLDASFGKLLKSYIEQLERDGKTSAHAIRKCVELHIENAMPDMWERPAADITTDDIIKIVAKLVKADKLRQAQKLQSYIRSAYASGMQARRSARSIESLRDLQITANPAFGLEAVQGTANARDRALSVNELRAYWRRVCQLRQPDQGLLALHLLSGGQRVEQLSRLQAADLDKDNDTITLRDIKGRRRRARLHEIPLIPAARKALDAMHGDHGNNIFSLTGGLTAAKYFSVQRRVREISAAMIEAGETKSSFAASDLRRTVETRLAAAGVSQEVRAQLQSHGLGGIQARHYDRHDYRAEKLAALETLYSLITSTDATVVPIIRAKAK